MRKLIAYLLIGIIAIMVNLHYSSIRAQNKNSYLSIKYQNPLPIKMGDPFILHANDGKYYIYGTSLNDGFEAYVSENLKEWKHCGQIYKGGTPSQWNKDCFWAPEVYENNGKYYLLYSSNWKDNPSNELENFRIGMAVSSSPIGPFTDLYNRPIFDPGYPIIDANLLFDGDKIYLYYSRCCYKHPVESEISDYMKKSNIYDNIEESWVYGVELKKDFSGIIGSPKLLICPSKSMKNKKMAWEDQSVLTKEINRRWTEGSFSFKLGNEYYIMYSANSYEGRYYSVGYAKSDSPLGVFTKSDKNPILKENGSKGGKVLSTGHNMVLKLPDGSLCCVYHGRMADNPKERVVFIDKMKIRNGEIKVLGPTTTPYKLNYSRLNK